MPFDVYAAMGALVRAEAVRVHEPVPAPPSAARPCGAPAAAPAGGPSTDPAPVPATPRAAEAGRAGSPDVLPASVWRRLTGLFG
ncbi:hypothetical protein ACFVYP_30285 [Kitasatospora sp. NPDC058201]|uniref:hypothetical protein n=1 Tax=unclassified Kitasatospora TaxID=2633591 RepID=UPI00365D8384